MLKKGKGTNPKDDNIIQLKMSFHSLRIDWERLNKIDYVTDGPEVMQVSNHDDWCFLLYAKFILINDLFDISMRSSVENQTS